MAGPALTEAARRITIAGQAVDYQLRRSRRRTIGLAIDQRGLRVGAPLQARIGEIETLIRQHGQWVLDKLDDWLNRPPLEKLKIGDGTIIFALESPLTVTVTPASRQRWRFSEPKLHLFVPPSVDVRIVLEKALREKARGIFTERLAHYAPQLGVSVPPLRISAARTRWGSCSHHGGIALNWRLILMPLAIVDYVVCHELAHLMEMNHSPRFWSVVEQLCPDWRVRRLELRRVARQIPQL
jgi:predicted metal-dependent hydrolase